MKPQSATQQKISRIDYGHSVVYPPSPDKRGMARITLNRKQYYFGQWGTPESHVMFGAWLAEFLRTGRTYKASDRLPEAASFIGRSVEAKRPIRPWLTAVILVAALTPSVAMYAWISSSRAEPRVDGMAMSARELAHVRAFRKLNAMKIAQQATDAEQTASILAKVMSKEGPLDAPPPRISAKPPVSKLD